MAPVDSLRVRGAIPFAAAAAAAVEGTTTARADADPFTRRGEAERGDADREDVARGERARRDNVCAAGSCADLGPACMLGRPRPGSPRCGLVGPDRSMRVRYFCLFITVGRSLLVHQNIYPFSCVLFYQIYSLVLRPP